ncbi:MAG TPA: tRNA preQ1(34) S-adenosylmethionine ribosyltransferase-isomerase QueA [Anaerolineae bacterium]|nr:tRNA preQ1(34) S-adenosylmethionine ribosyltransferase-isomerase QueA [Anaerolineae bacterium]HMR65426.1 tRNA preQ1(34) S-adenosylmethionine ribosyltransferase-isomerase QueA [Anaerolineae bacterium]
MDLQQFDYHLPPELIAQTPVEPRHASRLMVIDRRTGEISHHRFIEIIDYLQPGDILIANDSRVIPARLFGRKRSGGKVELLLLKAIDSLRWEALVGGKRVRPGTVIQLVINNEPSTNFEASVTLTIEADLGESRRLIRFDQPIEPLLEAVGHVPLPPYIHAPLADRERYQTVFSRIDGSTAAPTAGLHFTPEILLALRDKGVALDYVTLHIGLDTFKPVTVEQVEQHPIHREFAQLSAQTARRINETKLAGGRLVAVGTTAVRTLETAAWRSAGIMGSLKEAARLDPSFCPWQPVVAIEEETDLYIYPGYPFRVVEVMLTNFHLPKSTLLMLVSAFAGTELIRQAYQIALAEQYRFFSFGDAMLIL